jgi:ribosome-binding protein aMBF1 (putative translation factor)
MPQCDICGKVVAVPNRAICSGMKMNVCDECLKYCEKKVEYKAKTPKPPVKIKRVEPPKPRPVISH